MSNTTKLILLDSLLQEDRVLAPQGPSSISAVAELFLVIRQSVNVTHFAFGLSIELSRYATISKY